MAIKLKKFIRTEQEQEPATIGGSQYVPLDELYLWKENPWNHKKIIPRLAEALAIHGQVSPVIADANTNIIYKGNHTYQAINYLHKHMRSISNKINVTVAQIKKNIDTTMIKVEFKNFPSEQAAIAYGIADNNLSKGGKYDPETLVRIFNTDENYYTKNPQNMSFSERDIKIYREHNGLQVERKRQYDENDENFVGGDYMLLTFNTPEVGERLRDFLNIEETTRRLQFEAFYPHLDKKSKQFFEDVIDLPF